MAIVCRNWVKDFFSDRIFQMAFICTRSTCVLLSGNPVSKKHESSLWKKTESLGFKFFSFNCSRRFQQPALVDEAEPGSPSGCSCPIDCTYTLKFFAIVRSLMKKIDRVFDTIIFVAISSTRLESHVKFSMILLAPCGSLCQEVTQLPTPLAKSLLPFSNRQIIWSKICRLCRLTSFSFFCVLAISNKF